MFQTLFKLILAVGIIYLIYLLMLDPVLIFKSFLRGLKNNDRLRYKLIFSPIWIPIWIIDKLFNLKIYIDVLEEASVPVKIRFSDYDKYIQIDSNDLSHIKTILESFSNAFDLAEFNYPIKNTIINVTQNNDYTILKIEKDIHFETFNTIIKYIDNSAPQYIVYNVKGVLLNKIQRDESYFCFVDNAYSQKLIGKTYRNKKMYVCLDTENESEDRIYYNSNIDSFKNFKFDKFESEMSRESFKSLNINVI